MCFTAHVSLCKTLPSDNPKKLKFQEAKKRIRSFGAKHKEPTTPFFWKNYPSSNLLEYRKTDSTYTTNKEKK